MTQTTDHAPAVEASDAQGGDKVLTREKLHGLLVELYQWTPAVIDAGAAILVHRIVDSHDSQAALLRESLARETETKQALAVKIEAAYREGRDDGFDAGYYSARDLPFPTEDEDWLDSDARAALAEAAKGVASPKEAAEALRDLARHVEQYDGMVAWNIGISRATTDEVNAALAAKQAKQAAKGEAERRSP